MADHREIATAPGDLPASEIVRRHETVHDQFRHENTTTPLAPAPGDEVLVEAESGTGAAVERAEIRYTTDGSLPGETARRVVMERDGTDWRPFGGYVVRWLGTIPAHGDGTVVRYEIVGYTRDGAEVRAQDGQGFWYRYPAAQSVTVFAYRVRSGPIAPPWMDDAVIYQIFVDRFRRGDGPFDEDADLQAKHGGDFAGIVEALPYLGELGVTCLWLSPIGPAPTYHRYDATDYFSVDPVLGNVDDLRALTAAAHERGMRVLLDFVPSHLSSDHPAFVAARRDRNAETSDWFTFYEWPDSYRSFLDTVPSLVSLNTMSEGVRDYLKSSARFWMESGVDGFRLDHVIGHGMDFWVEFQRALEEVEADVVTIGEATDTGDALRRYRGRINTILDFPLARALRLTFATGQWSLAELDSFLDLYEAYMSDGPGRVSFLDNHDMDRFLHVAGQDRAALKLAALTLFTLPATPVLYYGTEIGATHGYPTSDRRRGGDALARQDMEWDRARWDEDLLAFFREAIALRRERAAAVRGTRRRLELNERTGTYAYELVPAGGEGRVAVALNLSDREQRVAIPGASETLLSTGESARLDGDAVVLPARTGAVVALGGE